MKRVCTKCGYQKRLKRYTYNNRTICPKCRTKSMKIVDESGMTRQDRERMKQRLINKPIRHETAEQRARRLDRQAYKRGGL